MKRPLLAVLACTICLFALIPPLAISQQDKPPQPAAGAQPAAQRSAQDIQMDLRAASNELRGALTGPNVLFDAKLREQQGPKAVPAIKKMLSLFDELAKTQPGEKEEIDRAKLDFNTMLVVFGDAAAKTDLEKQAAAKGEAGEGARGALLLAEWWKAGKDEAAQTSVLDNVQKLAKANPQSDTVAITLMKMSQVGAATEKLADRARDIVTTELKGEVAQQISQQANAEKKLKQMAGKPLEIAGTTVDGRPFSTKDWKGKVILVDFWATWCGPCIAELPRVKKIYKEYHDKGLEILGVSCDSELEDLKGFIAKNPDMPWPQLFDVQQNPKLQWHPLAKEYGINGIPTMFLIDKKGVVRTVEARQEFEELIPKMLQEKAE